MLGRPRKEYRISNSSNYICNCKSKSEVNFHETLVYDNGKCYYCGHYALQGSPSIPNNDYAQYLKPEWRNGPFTYTPRCSKKTIRRIAEYEKFSSKGMTDIQIAREWGITKQGMYIFKRKHIRKKGF